MGYKLEPNKKMKIRTARAAGTEDGKPYVIVEDAPAHYVSGFGMVGPGDTITLPADVKPGKWLREVNPSDVAKADADPDKAAELAKKAAEANAKDADKK